eukprot:ctg_321.g91
MPRHPVPAFCRSPCTRARSGSGALAAQTRHGHASAATPFLAVRWACTHNQHSKPSPRERDAHTRPVFPSRSVHGLFVLLLEAELWQVGPHAAHRVREEPPGGESVGRPFDPVTAQPGTAARQLGAVGREQSDVWQGRAAGTTVGGVVACSVAAAASRPRGRPVCPPVAPHQRVQKAPERVQSALRQTGAAGQRLRRPARRRGRQGKGQRSRQGAHPGARPDVRRREQVPRRRERRAHPASVPAAPRPDHAAGVPGVLRSHAERAHHAAYGQGRRVSQVAGELLEEGAADHRPRRIPHRRSRKLERRALARISGPVRKQPTALEDTDLSSGRPLTRLERPLMCSGSCAEIALVRLAPARPHWFSRCGGSHECRSLADTTATATKSMEVGHRSLHDATAGGTIRSVRAWGLFPLHRVASLPAIAGAGGPAAHPARRAGKRRRVGAHVLQHVSPHAAAGRRRRSSCGRPAPLHATRPPAHDRFGRLSAQARAGGSAVTGHRGRRHVPLVRGRAHPDAHTRVVGASAESTRRRHHYSPRRAAAVPHRAGGAAALGVPVAPLGGALAARAPAGRAPASHVLRIDRTAAIPDAVAARRQAQSPARHCRYGEHRAGGAAGRGHFRLVLSDAARSARHAVDALARSRAHPQPPVGAGVRTGR